MYCSSKVNLFDCVTQISFRDKLKPLSEVGPNGLVFRLCYYDNMYLQWGGGGESTGVLGNQPALLRACALHSIS